MQDQDLLTALLAVQHKENQRQWPFFLIGADLPNLPAVLADCPSYAERQFLYSTIGPLTPVDAADAMRTPVQARGGDSTPEALDVLVETSGCYPYFLQEYGKAIWNIVPDTLFELADALGAVEVGRRHLADGFFPSRWDRATPEGTKIFGGDVHSRRGSAAVDEGRRGDGVECRGNQRGARFFDQAWFDLGS